MDEKLKNKLDSLLNFLNNHQKIALAFSGGVDSAFLAYIIRKQLGKDNLIAFTARTELVDESEIAEAIEIAKLFDINHKIIQIDVLRIPEVLENRADRCYHCKKRIFLEIIKVAISKDINAVVDGSNADDDSEYRPGKQALFELNIISPLKTTGFTKSEIRECARYFHLPFADKPSSPCTATRFPYDTTLKPELLERVLKSERFLRSLGFDDIRVRCHENIARIEVPESRFHSIIEQHDTIAKTLKSFGFRYVTLDIEGLRHGSMDVTVKDIQDGS